MELGLCKSNAERVSKLFRIARVLVAEGIGALSMVPYGRQLNFDRHDGMLAVCCSLIGGNSAAP